MREIYLDNAATTKVDKIVADKIYDVMINFYGNPSSRHKKGIEAYDIIYSAKQSIAKLISCDPENIIFTSGGTESNNLAILGGLSSGIKDKNKDKNIIISTVEHSSVVESIEKLRSTGCKIYYVKPDLNGEIKPESIWNLIDQNTVLVSVMHINNETGNIYNIKQISKGVRYKNINTIIHCDGVQAFGKINVDVVDLDVDLYSFSGHKIHVPKGIGGLYIKEGITIKPMIVGGHQEYNYRCGTENVPGISGLGKICELIDINGNLNHIKKLYQILFNEISNIKNIHINSIGNNILPYIFNFSIIGYKSEIILNRLQKKNIFISNGSACSKGKRSRVLKGMDIKEEYIDSAIRVSLSKYNVEQDIIDFVKEIKNLI